MCLLILWCCLVAAAQTVHAAEPDVCDRTIDGLIGHWPLQGDGSGLDAFWYHTAGRVLTLPLTVLGGWVCFLWARDLYGARAGFLACLLWCFSPTVLGWGSTFTPDAACASLGILANYRFWKWLRSGDWTDVVFCGVALGFAELAKMTWVILFFLWPVLWLFWRWAIRGAESAPRPSPRQLFVVLLIGLFLINAGYGFEGSLTRLGEYEFASEALSGVANREEFGNRFRGSWLENLPVPVPWNYLRGMDQQKVDFEIGGDSYLLGEWSERGWWYYYIVALVFKASRHSQEFHPDGTRSADISSIARIQEAARFET